LSNTIWEKVWCQSSSMASDDLDHRLILMSSSKLTGEQMFPGDSYAPQYPDIPLYMIGPAVINYMSHEV
jgi:hypothetical protein